MGIFYFVDFGAVLQALAKANYIYLLPVILLYTFGLGARAAAWQTLLQEKAQFSRVFLIINAGYLLNNIFPLRLGELGRAFLIGRAGLGFWWAFSTILVERSFDLALVAGMVLSGLPIALAGSQANRAAMVVGFLVIIGLIALHFLARYREWTQKQINRLVGRWPRLQEQSRRTVFAFTSGLAALVDIRRFLLVGIWMCVTWVLALGAQYLLLKAFIPKPDFRWVVFGQGIVALGVALPSSPAFVGVLEAAWVGALSLFGVSPSIGLAYALTSHLVNIGVTGVLGAYALAREGESVGQLYKLVRTEAAKLTRNQGERKSN